MCANGGIPLPYFLEFCSKVQLVPRLVICVLLKAFDFKVLELPFQIKFV